MRIVMFIRQMALPSCARSLAVVGVTTTATNTNNNRVETFHVLIDNVDDIFN